MINALPSVFQTYCIKIQTIPSKIRSDSVYAVLI